MREGAEEGCELSTFKVPLKEVMRISEFLSIVPFVNFHLSFLLESK